MKHNPVSLSRTSPPYKESLLSIDNIGSDEEGYLFFDADGLPSIQTPGGGGAVGPDLTAIEALTGTGFAKRTAADTWALLSSIPWTSISTTPTTLVGYGITDSQPLDADLTAIAALVSTGGWAKRTAANTWNISTPTSSDVGLGLVENTTLSTWVGSTYLTTLGTITTGVWHGTIISPAYLGTGFPSSANWLRGDGAWTALATVATSGAYSDLSGTPAIGSATQAWDADLDAIAALVATNGWAKRTAANTWSISTPSAADVGLGSVEDAAASTLYVPLTRTVNGHALSANVTITAGDVGLGAVENTALSTWVGSTNITTLGTIVTGTWAAAMINAAYLGTGTPTSDKYLRGDSTWSVVAYSELSGTPTLGTIAALSKTSTGDITGDWPAAIVARVNGTTPTAYGLSLIDDVDAPAARATLSLGDSATKNVGTTVGTIAAGDDSRFTDSRTPTGSAGGDLTGTYPNPTLATTTVTTNSYGSTTQVATFTVDTKGRLTAAANATIPSAAAAATPSLRALGTTSTTAAAGDDARLSDSRAPNGSASGDLSGTYPSPGVAKIGGVAVTVDTDGTLAANSDAKLATQKAAKTYTDTKIATSVLTTNEDLLIRRSGVPAALHIGAEGSVPRVTAGIIVWTVMALACIAAYQGDADDGAIVPNQHPTIAAGNPV